MLCVHRRRLPCFEISLTPPECIFINGSCLTKFSAYKGCQAQCVLGFAVAMLLCVVQGHGVSLCHPFSVNVCSRDGGSAPCFTPYNLLWNNHAWWVHGQAKTRNVFCINMEWWMWKQSQQDFPMLLQEYEGAVEDRNHTGIMLIDRNDELCILYEKANTQEEVMRKGVLTLHILLTFWQEFTKHKTCAFNVSACMQRYAQRLP